MQERLEALRQMSARLEPEAGLRKEWLGLAADYAERFLESLSGRHGYVPDDRAAETALADGLREEATDLPELLEIIEHGVDRVGVNESTGHFFGFIPGSGLYHGALGDYLAAVSNRYVGVAYAGPGAVRLERQLITWMAREIGYPDAAEGDLTSGGSLGNLGAIVTAREAYGLRSRSLRDAVVYLSAQTHHSIAKALRIAGLGDVRVREVAVDERHRMSAHALEAELGRDRDAGLRPWLIVASAGATDTGAIDPLAGLADLAQRENLWLHVDAAYGGAFVLCEPGRRRLAGIERAHSIVIDPHKGLFAPFGTGLLLVRDGRALRRAYAYEADYMQDADRAGLELVSPSETSPELTRPFRGLRLWLALRLAGVGAFRAALEEKLLLARYFHEALAASPLFEVGAEPDLSIVTFWLRTPLGDEESLNEALVEAVQRDGRIYLSSTRLNGRFTLRLAILNARTHVEHVERAITTLSELGRKVLGR